MSWRLLPACAALAFGLAGCALGPGEGDGVTFSDAVVTRADGTVIGGVEPDRPERARQGTAVAGWSAVTVPARYAPGQPLAETDGPYLLDTGDRLRIFVYGQPNLSRLYIVDQEGRVAVPLIGNVKARGLTTTELQAAIRSRLGAQFVRDPQVTVDIQQNRPFYILGEVKNAGQFPYMSGMTVETAVAIAGGYSDRADESRARLTRRSNGFSEVFDVPRDQVIRPGDTVYVYERLF